MIRLLIDLLMFLRKILMKLTSSLFDKVTDKETGKLTFISPNNLRPAFMWLSFLAFMGLVGYKMYLLNHG